MLEILVDPTLAPRRRFNHWPRIPYANRVAMAEPLQEIASLLRDPEIEIPEEAQQRIRALATHPASPAFGSYPVQARFAAFSLADDAIPRTTSGRSSGAYTVSTSPPNALGRDNSPRRLRSLSGGCCPGPLPPSSRCCSPAARRVALDDRDLVGGRGLRVVRPLALDPHPRAAPPHTRKARRIGQVLRVGCQTVANRGRADHTDLGRGRSSDD